MGLFLPPEAESRRATILVSDLLRSCDRIDRRGVRWSRMQCKAMRCNVSVAFRLLCRNFDPSSRDDTMTHDLRQCTNRRQRSQDLSERGRRRETVQKECAGGQLMKTETKTKLGGPGKLLCNFRADEPPLPRLVFDRGEGAKPLPIVESSSLTRKTGAGAGAGAGPCPCTPPVALALIRHSPVDRVTKGGQGGQASKQTGPPSSRSNGCGHGAETPCEPSPWLQASARFICTTDCTGHGRLHLACQDVVEAPAPRVHEDVPVQGSHREEVSGASQRVRESPAVVPGEPEPVLGGGVALYPDPGFEPLHQGTVP